MAFSDEMEEREDEENSASQQLNGEVNRRCFSCAFCQPSQGELHVKSSYWIWGTLTYGAGLNFTWS